jgi:hypothetical protein
VEERPLREGSGIIRDEVIVLDSEKDPDHLMQLRRIEVWLEDQQETIAFLTNNLKLATSTIASIYRDRWPIELFFKIDSVFARRLRTTRVRRTRSQGSAWAGCVSDAPSHESTPFPCESGPGTGAVGAANWSANGFPPPFSANLQSKVVH